MKPTTIIIALTALALTSAGCTTADRPTVLLTGFWPPSNEMLRPFSPDPELNGGTWAGQNWRNLGCDVYAYFPTFPNGTDANPAGTGTFRVDYQAVSADLDRLTRKHRPRAIIAFGRGDGPWEIEYNAINRTEWVDDYSAPTQPTSDTAITTSAPARVLNLTLPAQQIADAVNAADLPLTAWVDWTGHPGSFLCNYTAYKVAQYQRANSSPDSPNPCTAAGFIHIAPNVPTKTAQTAAKITLQQVITSLKANKPKK
ncbi:pyrrolidone-carboxylate peptidase [Anaerohalosphaera lusitana]|uniref:Pyrrolidone-carboxylate peptidase n=1 Tax=Anaerohalosphaera lusitana TaxID=1936003 RepID=A0A1U9NI26_9BACT|nr:hypothetical protein [Anaerohalosphaera lusitana]AQT67465.1 pyrrolidone-carboxylate peptidase [Anaerohalosphaera lusitana]